jgi:hypothetical protein
MLYQKMEESSNLQHKLEQAQLQQAMFLSQMMQQSPPTTTPANPLHGVLQGLSPITPPSAGLQSAF